MPLGAEINSDSTGLFVQHPFRLQALFGGFTLPLVTVQPVI